MHWIHLAWDRGVLIYLNVLLYKRRGTSCAALRQSACCWGLLHSVLVVRQSDAVSINVEVAVDSRSSGEDIALCGEAVKPVTLKVTVVCCDAVCFG